jgi:hypothetical protein
VSTVTEPDRIGVGQLAHSLFAGFLAHTASIHVARDPRCDALVPRIPVGGSIPTVTFPRIGGDERHVDFASALRYGRQSPRARAEFDRIFLAGALLTLGDALHPHYFHNDPLLEVVRHLRNGVGHGNRFRFKHGHPNNHPNRFVGPGGAVFEVTDDVEGRPVLFDFMGPGDVTDLLLAVRDHLGVGDDGNPVEKDRSRTRRPV